MRMSAGHFRKSMQRITRFTLACTVTLLSLNMATTSFAQNPFDGSFDPFNKNNKLGGHIETPFTAPRIGSNGDNSSRLAVQTPGIDENGYVYEDSPYGNRTYSGKRGQLKRDSRGKAFWESGRLWIWAAAKWQKQLNEQDRAQQQARQAQQAQQAELARQQQQQAWQQQQAQQAQQAEFARQQQVTANRPVQDEFYSPKLGIYFQVVRYPNGQLGARLTRNPVPDSPLNDIHLESGDTVYELDGQRIRQLNDLETHFAETRVDFVNIRTNRPQAGTVTLP